MPPLFTSAFLRLTGSHFLSSLGFASMVLLPLYLAHLGASRAEIGGVMAAASVGGLSSRPLVGWALDRVGRRPTLMVGGLFTMLGLVLVLFIDRMGPAAWIARVLFGMGEGALFAGYFTYAADIIPAERRTEGLAIFGVSGIVSMVVNPLVSWIGIEAPSVRWFLPCVALAVGGALVVLRTIPEPPPRTRSVAEATFGHTVRVLADRALWPPWLASLVFGGSVSIFMTFVTVVAADRGNANPALVWLTYAGGATLVRLGAPRLPDRVGPHNMVAPSLGVYAISLLLAANAQTETAFLVVGLLGGFGHGYCFPVLTSQVVSRCPDHARGSALALFTAIFGLSALTLTPLMGWVADTAGDATMLTLAALGVQVGLVGWAVLEHQSR